MAGGLGANAQEYAGLLQGQFDQVARGFDGGVLTKDLGRVGTGQVLPVFCGV